MDVIAIMNTIRDNASATYQARIPELTRTNLEDVRYAMIDDDNVMVANEFTNSLLNKVFKSHLISKRFQNPLKSLKKGKKPLGDTVEEIYVNFIKGAEYDPDIGAKLLERTLPDVKTVYHRMNYKMKYRQTFSQQALSKAFSSFEALESFFSSIVAAMYNSADLDEFMNMKQLLKSALDANAMKVVEVPDPLLGAEEGKEFIKSVKTVSSLMVYPSTDWNGYLTAQTTDTTPITTFTRKEEQVLIIDTATDTSVSVDVLANTFNMTVAEFNDTRKIVIDVFPDPKMRAAIVDEQFFQIWDDLFVFKSFDNPEGLYDNYFLHVWQTLAYSILVNAVAFCVADEAAG
ncbi:MAG: hypothetical protein J6T08_02565 [Lentisphaeria bacterium]|nr:hypothetical protein [Lentisphaeria bacterium]